MSDYEARERTRKSWLDPDNNVAREKAQRFIRRLRSDMDALSQQIGSRELTLDFLSMILYDTDMSPVGITEPPEGAVVNPKTGIMSWHREVTHIRPNNPTRAESNQYARALRAGLNPRFPPMRRIRYHQFFQSKDMAEQSEKETHVFPFPSRTDGKVTIYQLHLCMWGQSQQADRELIGVMKAAQLRLKIPYGSYELDLNFPSMYFNPLHYRFGVGQIEVASQEYIELGVLYNTPFPAHKLAIGFEAMVDSEVP